MNLPAVGASIVAEAVEALPARLRKKLDDMVVRAAEWPVTVTGSEVVVRVDESTVVTLTLTGGVVEAAHCGCLLAPNCLHRAAVLSRAPVAGSTEATAEPAQPADESIVDDRALTAPERAAAEGLWAATIAILRAGVTGSGAVARAALLRASHEARTRGLHRAAAAGRRLATRLQAAWAKEPQYRLADATDDVRELLTLTRQLRDPGYVPSAAALGSARRAYETRGSLRLTGLCTIPIVAESGHAGACTYVVDRDGRMWTVANLMPGGVERAAGAGDATVALGEAALSHRALGRAGLVVSGATSSDSGQLGAGRAVKAVSAAGAGWHEPPLAPLWTVPVPAQLDRAFAALTIPVQDRPVGDDLLFLRVRIIGGRSDAVVAVADDGTPLTLTVPVDQPALAYRENLRVLADAPGVEVLLVAQPVPSRQATVYPFALSPVPDGGLVLPKEMGGHADLGYDRLHSSAVRGDSPVAPEVALPAAATHDPQLKLLRRNLERVVSGGMAAQAHAQPDDRRLRGARFDTGADLLAALGSAARNRTRDTFGRVAADDGQVFAEAWLAAAVYEEAATAALTRAYWQPVATL